MVEVKPVDRNIPRAVGELSRRAGVPVSTLHFYERQGLISAARTEGNQRRYGREVLRRVSFIRIAQRVGIPLNHVKAALDGLPDGRTPTAADWAKLSRSWRTDLDDRIRDLQHLRDDLASCIGCGCLSLNSCRLHNPADQLGVNGPGPQRWQSEERARRRHQRALRQGAGSEPPSGPTSVDGARTGTTGSASVADAEPLARPAEREPSASSAPPMRSGLNQHRS